MSIRSGDDTAAAVRELVLSLVGADIQVSVFVDRILAGAYPSAGPSRPMGPGGARISVEMVGPDSDGLLVARGEAHAWCKDEILNAVRRAAERIMRAHPAWRRQLH